MKRTLYACYGVLALIAALLVTPAMAQTKKKARPKQPAVGVLGTKQMAGGDGVFGATYTLADSGGYIYNVSIVSAEYSVSRHNMHPGAVIIPKVGEKLLLLHLRLQNPKSSDAYIGGNFLAFETVAADNITRKHGDYLRLASAKEDMGMTLKPGQKLPEDVLAVCVIPAAGGVPKLIVNAGRKGTSEAVTRYFLGKTPNVVRPLPPDDADPADKTGATARAEVPAKIGETVAAGYYDLRLDSVAFVPDGVGEARPGDNKHFFVATLTVTNKTWDKNYFNDSLAATLVTADDEKTAFDRGLLYKGKRDEPFEGRQFEPGESVTMRLLFPVPKDTAGKTLKVAEVIDNSGGTTRVFVFDVSGMK